MKIYQDLIFEALVEADIEILTPIMKRAFDEDTRIHLGRASGGPPGYDNGDFLRQFALHEQSTAYKISYEGNAIGAVILWIDTHTHQNFLGNLFLDIPFENKGFGKKIWSFIEQEYPDTKVWRTETPIFSHRNHNFYVNKCGFQVVKIKNPKNLEEGSFILEKVM